jgi:hypothetical protein
MAPPPNEDPLNSAQHDTQAIEQLLTLSPPATRRPLHAPDSETDHMTNIAASSTSTAVTFLISLATHYNTLSDSVTPHLFAQLSREYHTRKLDETSFYVAAYRLLFETGATHLMPGLRALLPHTWREVDLGWLNNAVEGDSERQRATARDAFGELATMVESSMTQVETRSGSAVTVEKMGNEISKTKHTKIKKRTPINGFRATHRTDGGAVETPLRSGAPTPTSDSGSRLACQSSLGNSLSPTLDRRPQNSISPFAKKLSLKKSNKSPLSDNQRTPQPTTPSTHTPLPTDKVSKLPPSSSVTHLGPIYPTTRAIIARSHKPYIHALCGMRFGHPAEVQRHHNGQGGRPGCWENSGKPDGDDGRWDRDASCKVKLADLEYVKVQEGWVVTSWGSVGVEKLLQEGAGEVLKGTTEKPSGARAEAAKKRKVVAKPQLASKVDIFSMSASGSESEIASEDAEEIDGYTESMSPDIPEVKRQRTLKTEESAASFSEEQAAVRAAALGLRTRK